MPTFSDKEVSRFYKVLFALEEELIDQLELLLSEEDEPDDAEASEIVYVILQLLASAAIPISFFQTYLTSIFRSKLASFDVPEDLLFPQRRFRFLENRLEDAIQSINAKVRRAFDQLGNRRQAIRSMTETYSDGSREVLTKTLVSLPSSGRIKTFPLSYYGSMVADNAVIITQADAALAAAKYHDTDLVQISPNPSTIGDYCDAYRGKIFSISGKDTRFIPLSSLPNGGPPFHPWCHHTMKPVLKSAFTKAELKNSSSVSSDYLLLPGEKTVSRIAKNWRNRNAT